MPVYEYECTECGQFEALAPMSAYADPCQCPSCGSQSPRVMRTPPGLSTMSAGARNAHATNERSADSPKRASEGYKLPNRGKRGTGALRRANGSKSFPNARPWMISH